MKTVIIGGVAGGASAAARLRRLDEKASIVVLEKGEYVSYANCGLPYYIGGIIEEEADLLVQTPASLKSRFNLDVRVLSEALEIDRAKKEVVVKDLKTGETYREAYDKLVLAPGAEPFRPQIPGVDSPRVFTLRTVPDAEKLKKLVDGGPRRAIIIGAGYIGMEMAENLREKGVFVTLVEMAPQVIAPLDSEMAALVHAHLKTKNVEFYLGDQVTSLKVTDGGITAELKSGKLLPADFAVLSVGVWPDTRLALRAGLKIGPAGGIAVNEFMQTSDQDIYAVGDAIEFKNPLTGKPCLTPLAGPANKQARIAADNIAGGNKTVYKGTVGTAIAKVFDISVAVTGLNERQLKANGMEYYSTITHSSSNAGYYPGALPLTIKLNYGRKDGKLYGAQVVGFKGADKAAEALSLACGHGMTVRDLAEMDQAYAPPFSSAKSPVNMAGFVACNVVDGLVKAATRDDVKTAGEDAFLLDVRTSAEAAVGKVPGSYLIPVDKLRSRLAEVPKDKKIFVTCAVGLRAYIASRILAQNGYREVYNLTGGFKTFEACESKQGNEDVYGKYCIQKNDDIHNGPCPPPGAVLELNARGMQCPGPIMKLNDFAKSLPAGARVRVLASDPGFLNDAGSWANVTGNKLIGTSQDGGVYSAVIEKGGPREAAPQARSADNMEKTIVVFNDDLDRALAAFVIANGALSMGKKVTLFFTFWGLNILKRKGAPRAKKDLISRMFGLMLPKNTGGLALSKLNMFGIGPRLMRHIMKAKNIESLEGLMDKALKGGVNIIACQMSMDVMGIKREELIDGIKIGGVATYIEATDSANTNLFI